MGVEKCQGCAYLNPIMFHCGKYLRGIETAVYLCDTAKPQTNADRIRAMSDEELAKFLLNRDLDDVEKASKAVGFTYKVDREQCLVDVIDWLKQEVVSDG